MSGYIPFVDKFDTALDPGWSVTGPVTVSGGKASLPVDATRPTLVSPSHNWTLDGGKASHVEITATPTAATARAVFQCMVDTSNAYGFQIYVQSSGTRTLAGQRLANGVYAAWLFSTTYDPVAHRWLRLRVDGPDMVWETSPDALLAAPVWTELYREALAFSVASAAIRMQTYDPNSVANQQLLVDNVNVVYQAPATTTYGWRTVGGQSVTVSAV